MLTEVIRIFEFQIISSILKLLSIYVFVAFFKVPSIATLTKIFGIRLKNLKYNYKFFKSANRVVRFNFAEVDIFDFFFFFCLFCDEIVSTILSSTFKTTLNIRTRNITFFFFYPTIFFIINYR